MLYKIWICTSNYHRTKIIVRFGVIDTVMEFGTAKQPVSQGRNR
jgi:hypothetical protein